jgi:hypothetical protein
MAQGAARSSHCRPVTGVMRDLCDRKFSAAPIEPLRPQNQEDCLYLQSTLRLEHLKSLFSHDCIAQTRQSAGLSGDGSEGLRQPLVECRSSGKQREFASAHTVLLPRLHSPGYWVTERGLDFRVQLWTASGYRSEVWTCLLRAQVRTAKDRHCAVAEPKHYPRCNRDRTSKYIQQPNPDAWAFFGLPGNFG